MNASMGATVATAGDVNGDGYSDVVVGTPNFDNGQIDEGRAYLYLGSPTGLSPSPAWTAESHQAGAGFGTKVAPAGDGDGDGYAEVLVSAPRFDNGEQNEGRVYLYLGSTTGLAAAPAWTTEVNEVEAQWGYAIGTAGDVNGDGYSDVIVGTPFLVNVDGIVLVFLGSEAGLGQPPAWGALGSQPGANFGGAVGTAGDVNGDGFSDVIVGAELWDNGQTNEGRAFVYLSSPGGLVDINPDWTWEPDLVNAHYGCSVATAGDTNGDGYSEIIVGASYHSNGQDLEGAAFVYLGSPAGPGTNATWEIESNSLGARFGHSVAATEVNGDGYSDILVGAVEYTNGQMAEGRAFLYIGSVDGLSLSPSWTAESDQADAWFGYSVGTAGDVNGDGFSDVVVGVYGYTNGQSREGQARAYHGSAGGVSEFARLQVSIGQPNALHGNSVAAAGDVNGDGYSDFVTGAPYFDNSQTDEGIAFIIVGEPDDAAIALEVEGNQPNAHLGWSVAGAGDVNGDGYSDVIIGAPDYANGQIGEGRAIVYHGSPAGVVPTPAWTVESNQDFAQLGWSVASAGDVNGDGFSDVLVGAYQFDNGHDDEGRAFVYLGSASGLATTPAWTAEANQGSAGFAYSVASAGDVNRDGFSDVIVGCYLCDNGQGNEGRAFAYLGSASGLATSAAWTAESNQAGGNFGFSVASAGDVNGDGFSDVIVGADTFDNGHGDEGRAFVFQGSAGGLGTSPLWTAEPNQIAAQFGFSVSSAGDVNADGFSDVVIGAPFFDNGEGDEGGTFVYHGSASGPLASPGITIDSNEANAWLGYAVSIMGDVNGDGFSDVLIGAPNYTVGDQGWVFGHLGNGQGTFNAGEDRIARQARLDGSAPIALLGKSSHNAFLAKALGRTAAGRGRVRMEVEVKRLGVPFNGQGRVVGAEYSDTGAPVMYAGSSVPLSELVLGLQSNATYHWRLRIASSSPFFPWSPWLTMPGNGGTETDFRTGGMVIGIDSQASAAVPLILHPISPNPFAAPGEIAYSLPAAVPVRLAIYDVQGRARAVLQEGLGRPGRHVVTWDARSGSGDRLEAGVYFVQLTAGDRVETRKLTLVR